MFDGLKNLGALRDIMGKAQEMQENMRKMQEEAARKHVSADAGGGMLAFELAGGGAAVRRFVGALGLVQLIPSLGGVESSVSVPALTSHRGLSPERRAELGIADGLVRVSAGIEETEDVLADVAGALDGLLT